MEATGLSSRTRHIGANRVVLGDGPEAAAAPRLGSYPGAGSDGDYAAEYDPSYGRDTDRWVMDEWGDPEPEMPAGWPNATMPLDEQISVLEEAIRWRNLWKNLRVKTTADWHLYQRAMANLERLVSESSSRESSGSSLSVS